ncbi:MAG: BolA/IbaG family iron-sulfur metabolism protein [Deltaproteobacteria bacterium]|nr:BolA/IbaG family iron-sulfur metabolism protein [Deltaproteobacteria bacterium]MBI3390522.1 BolA/IbaG family iron-sulfur metabolism protein [Deltaproteobacteria bacterium]
MVHPDEISSLITAALPDAQVSVRDLTGGGDHFEVTVVSSAFAGKGLVDQHQMVYTPLRDAMVQRIHALTLKTYTPDQYQRAPKSLRVVS